LPALAQDLSWSGYGTIGYAQSNRGYAYQRSIDSSGTFDRDSVFGLQGDLRISPQWSATVQAKLAPSLKSDDRWDFNPAWAFVAFRPADDWLLRAGRMRIPLYLYSESLDLGVAHDMARLPAEMYSVAPSTDFNGLSLAKTWPFGERELTLDAYSGSTPQTVRIWLRDALPPQLVAGANFLDAHVRASGAVLTLRSRDSQLRAGLHFANTHRPGGETFPVSYPFVSVAPGLGYYQVDNRLPGPGAPRADAINNTVFTIGLDQALGADWRVTAEFVRNRQRDTEVGSDTRGGYIALLRRFGDFTPYASLARLRASDTALDWHRRLTGTTLPPFIPGADAINAAQRAAAESIYALDQRSVAFGASWALDASQKLKFEWMHTRVGQVSRLVDTPPGSATPSHTGIDVWSINYSFSF
jgi:hypothetical protein